MYLRRKSEWQEILPLVFIAKTPIDKVGIYAYNSYCEDRNCRKNLWKGRGIRMMISTKGRYALRVMLDLAEHNNGEYISLKEISDRQEISRKYLEGIMTALSKAHLVDSSSGKTGGYRLLKPAEEYPVGEILRTVESDMVPVACMGESDMKCARADTCYTMPFWMGLGKVIDHYLDSHTLHDLLEEGRSAHCSCLKAEKPEAESRTE